MSQKRLHLTNGRSAVSLMREAGIDGRIVSWDDVLHEGPVPADLSVAALREVRADFLAAFASPSSGMSRAAIAQQLTERDDALAALDDVDEIVLWFEHDLYDQLQLLQIIDRLDPSGPPVTAVHADTYLGHLPVAAFAGLDETRRPLTPEQGAEARRAWDAFRQPDPTSVAGLLPGLSALPHLAPALRRHLQQFPSVANGLSRTEQQALEVLAGGVTRIRDLYRISHHDREEAIFMGDLAFLAHLEALHDASPRLVAGIGPASHRLSLDDEIALTAEGRRVLAGDADRVRLCGIDRWLGGVHLTGRGPVWRHDSGLPTMRLV